MEQTFVMNEKIVQAMHQLNQVDAAFQRKALLKLKKEIMASMDDSLIEQEKRSYLLHQLNNVHSAEEMSELFKI